MKVTLNVPARLARDIIAQAHCRYWLDNYTWRVRPDGNGLHIGAKLSDTDANAPDVPTPRAYIGAAAIAEGLRLMLTDGRGVAQCAARILEGTNDGPDADALLQYAAYGKLVWG